MEAIEPSKVVVVILSCHKIAHCLTLRMNNDRIRECCEGQSHDHEHESESESSVASPSYRRIHPILLYITYYWSNLHPGTMLHPLFQRFQ